MPETAQKKGYPPKSKHEDSAEVFPLIKRWCLITYDISADAGKQRYKFLKRARAMGAMQYSESCYLLPFTEESFNEAQKLARVGKCYVWLSTIQSEGAAKVSHKYHDYVARRVDTILERLNTAETYFATGQHIPAKRMGVKTLILIKQLQKISTTKYKEKWLRDKIVELVDRFKVVYGFSKAQEENKPGPVSPEPEKAPAVAMAE